MFAITIDQRGSRAGPDHVPELLGQLDRDHLVRAFERTAGDEVQGLSEDPLTVVDLVVDVARDQQWWIGVGVGPVDPLASSVRASNGPALVAARRAVERAKRAVTGTCVEPSLPAGAEDAFDAETALQLLAGFVSDRTPEGLQAIDAMKNHDTQAAAARALGISPQAMSRRLRVARWNDESRIRALAVRLLERADASSSDPS